jgi:hypothetical protein
MEWKGSYDRSNEASMFNKETPWPRAASKKPKSEVLGFALDSFMTTKRD